MGAGSATRRGAVLAVAALLLVGCTSGEPDEGAAPSSAPSASAPPTPSPALTDAEGRELTEDEARAFREATDVVVAYRQTIVDLYSGARTDLNDLYAVATGSLLDRDLRQLQQSLGSGARGKPTGAQVVLVEATPKTVALGSDSRVIVRACIDATAVTGVAADGTETPGGREVSDYTVSRTSHLPAPGWAVTRVQGDADPKDRQC
jgi:hypothetical protein